MLKFFSHFLLIISCVTARVSAQVPTLYNHISNQVHTIHSRVLNEDRRLYIHVPAPDSGHMNTPLPVLYLLDGENHFHIVSAYIDYLRHWQVIPPTIVVGIINVNRAKDLTPTNSFINFDGEVEANYKLSGGNGQFLDFIQQELMPYMAANYTTSKFRILAGHSFGGIAAINCMFTRPEMFDAFIAVSPSLWWDNKYILQLTARKLIQLPALRKKFFYSNGNEDGSFKSDILCLDSLVKHAGLNGLENQYVDYPHEDHMTEPIPAYYDALRFIYKDWADTTMR